MLRRPVTKIQIRGGPERFFALRVFFSDPNESGKTSFRFEERKIEDFFFRVPRKFIEFSGDPASAVENRKRFSTADERFLRAIHGSEENPCFFPLPLRGRGNKILPFLPISMEGKIEDFSFIRLFSDISFDSWPFFPVGKKGRIFYYSERIVKSIGVGKNPSFF